MSRAAGIARIPPACFTYAKTCRLPPHLMQTNTSKSNAFLSSSAQSTRGVLSFLPTAKAGPLASSGFGSAPA